MPVARFFSAFFAAFFLIFQVSKAQNIVSGVVKTADGEPLIAVSVAEKGTTNGALTDLDGLFRLTLKSSEAVLVVSFLGFESQETAVAGRSFFDIILNENESKLSEVVVTAFGIERQKRSLGYSTESQKGETLLRSNAPNLVNSMAGRMAGVVVTQPNGVEGGTTRIVIRGNSNITGNNQPLIVIDGVPLENEPGFADSPDRKEITGGRDWGSAINQINPADVESVEILKGPSAAALYGARGKNGAILYTMKKGRERKGVGVDYLFSARSIQPVRFRNVQNVFGAGGPISENAPVFEKNAAGEAIYPTSLLADKGPGGVPTTESFGYYGGAQSWGPRMDGQNVRWWDGSIRPFSPQPDNQKLFYKNGSTATHNLAFSGGSAGSTARFSFTRTDHDAVTPNSGYRQNTVALSGILKVSERIRADFLANYMDFERKNSPALSNDAGNSYESGMLYSYPRSYQGENFDYENADGTRRDFAGWPYSYVSPFVIWNAQNHNTFLRRDKWLGSVGMTFEATKWLHFQGRAGVDQTSDEVETRRKPIDRAGLLIDDGSFYPSNFIGYEHELGKQKVLNSELFALFQPQKLLFDGLESRLRLGGATWSRDDYGLFARGSRRWRDPLLYNFSNTQIDPQNPLANLPEIGERFYQKKLNSAIGLLDLTWRDWLFVQITGRNDWSSALPMDNNSYFYPSANVAFLPTVLFRNRISEKISHLKIRFAASQTGSDDEPFQLDKIVQSGSFNGQNTGSLPSKIPPIALRPQRANSWETGLEFGLFDDRVTADLTYYFLHSFDQLLESPVPASSGFESIRINTGALENQGIEAVFSARIVQKKAFSWRTGFNFAKNRSRLVALDAGADILELANVWGSNGPSIAVKKGEAYGTIVGFDYVRDEATGQKIVSDDGRFFKLTETKTPIRIFSKDGKFKRFANATPKFTGGWTNELRWKNWKIESLVGIKWGGDQWFGSYAIGLQSGQSPETLLEREGGGLPFLRPDGSTENVGVILEGVRADGQPNEKVVHYYYKYLNSGGWGRIATAPAVVENSWIKLNEVVLSYALPSKMAARTRIFQSMSVAVVGRDLFYFFRTAPDGINPEGSIGAGNAQGLEFGAMPGMRTVGVTVSAGF